MDWDEAAAILNHMMGEMLISYTCFSVDRGLVTTS
jgi:hypothetical protein